VARRFARPINNTRGHILDCAVGLLREHGFERLGQLQVARAAGVSQGHLTYYFPRKTDLLVAVARHSVERVAEELRDFLASDGWPGADASMRARVTALVSFLVKDRQRTRLLLSLAIKAHTDPQLRDILAGHIRQARARRAAGMGAATDDPAVAQAQATLWGIAVQHLLVDDDDCVATDALVCDLLPSLVPDGG
jgi:AcrR family transcriptional regulator